VPQLIAGENRMGVRVDEPRQQRATLQIDKFGAVRGEVSTDLCDGSVPNAGTGAAWQECRAVEDRPVEEKDMLGGSGHGYPFDVGSRRNHPRIAAVNAGKRTENAEFGVLRYGFRAAARFDRGSAARP
jgi:hypothetical protein